MAKEITLVLNSRQIFQKLTRIAHHLMENYYKEKELVIVGIAGNGSVLATELVGLLKKSAEFEVELTHIEIHKEKPLSRPILYSGDMKTIKNKHLVLVDDVLNSGQTLMYASKFLLDFQPKSLSTVALVDRFHRKFPIRADFVGLTLSTNIKEHVRVDMTPGTESVYLE